MKIKVVIETDAGEIVACDETPSFDVDEAYQRLIARHQAQRLVVRLLREAYYN